MPKMQEAEQYRVRRLPEMESSTRQDREPDSAQLSPSEFAHRLQTSNLRRLRRDGINTAARFFIIPHGKAGDIRVVLSVPIVQALRIALDAGEGELVFQARHR